MRRPIPRDLDAGGRLYSPFDDPPRHPAAVWAIEDLRRRVGEEGLAPDIPSGALEGPRGGTMLGVLVVRGGDGLEYLRAFAGEVAGRVQVPGWAPPLYDAADFEGARVAGAAALERLEARAVVEAPREALAVARAAASDGRSSIQAELERLRAERRSAKASRARRRAEASVAEMERLEAESQHTNARIRDQRRALRRELQDLDLRVRRAQRRVGAYTRLRRLLSRRLLWALQQAYRIPTCEGAKLGLWDIFPGGPPGGAGDCAGAKLVGYAVAQGLEMVALAETWWGPPSGAGQRSDGVLYAACQSKCGPILAHMLEGLDVADPVIERGRDVSAVSSLVILYEDEELVVVDKPSGLLSVPGREIQDSIQTRLRDVHPEMRAAHRLDQDTSGVLLLAKTLPAYRWVQAEFAGRRVIKSYVAVVEGVLSEDAGRIELAFRLDPNDRPRQVFDPVAGKLGRTRWRVLTRQGGTTRVLFEPETGRTHQLRCHAAHPRGLGAPIVGDRLYGQPAERLLLHASKLCLQRPRDGAALVFESRAPF